jgi:hypothetical protein
VAAIAVSLSLAVVATALMARSVGALRAARADFERTRAEYLLAGVQQQAALGLATGSGLGAVAAEPEAGKISVATAADLDSEALSRFGVKNPQRLTAWLREAAAGPTAPADLVAADQAAGWKACAPAMISAFGRAASLNPPRVGSPIGMGVRPGLGEVWRLSASTPNGWTDERIVRFTGVSQRPAAVIWRRFYRSAGGEKSCAAIFVQPKHG